MTTNPTPPADRAALCDRIAAAIWERQNPGRRWADCESRWQADAEADAAAVLAVLPPPADRAAILAATLREVLDTFSPMKDTHDGPVAYYDGSADIEPEQYDRWRAVLNGELRRMATETPAAEPWPSVTDYALEVWETDEWVGISHRRKTLDEARERRESYRRRFPGARFRIVRWDETSTVAECDPEPAAGARQDGAQPSPPPA